MNRSAPDNQQDTRPVSAEAFSALQFLQMLLHILQNILPAQGSSPGSVCTERGGFFFQLPVGRQTIADLLITLALKVSVLQLAEIILAA